MLGSPKATRRRTARIRWLALFLTLATVGLAACGDDDEGATDAATTSAAGGDASAGTEGDEKIAIKTHAEIDIPNGGPPAPGESIGGGKVLDGSSLGEEAFCTHGTFSDVHGDDPNIGLVDRTFECADGNLRIGFTPGVPQGRTQAGPWKIVSGTGAFEGLQGDGQMKIVYEPGTHATEGDETFTGTVTP